MTEREKIANILNSTEISQELSKDDIYKFANALIAAGIGDVKEAKAETMHYWNTRQEVLDEWERAEHRAEVAERALGILAHKIAFTDLKDISMTATEKVKQKAIEQTEKELAEGKHEKY